MSIHPVGVLESERYMNLELKLCASPIQTLKSTSITQWRRPALDALEKTIEDEVDRTLGDIPPHRYLPVPPHASCRHSYGHGKWTVLSVYATCICSPHNILFFVSYRYTKLVA